MTGLLVLEERRPRGDVGPCCNIECRERATTILTLDVHGLVVTAWVCDKHRTFA
jgi:hypothetical protein